MLGRRCGSIAYSRRWLVVHSHEVLSPRSVIRGCWRAALVTEAVRQASSSSTRWLSRQGRDPFTKASKVNALKSRAAFKLLEIDQKYQLFKPGQTVVDLGYAPGSWSQVVISRVRPGGHGRGRVVGIDVIPAQPPKGVSTIQGDFLSPGTRQMLYDFVRDDNAGRPAFRESFAKRGDEEQGEDEDNQLSDDETMMHPDLVVDVLLSDMTEPLPLVNTWLNSVVNPYRRMMNTSGNAFKDHAGSMDLCLAALTFGYDTLVVGGHFLCKYYQGSEDKDFEQRLKALFEKVHRIKPESSRKESREGFFLGLRRRANVARDKIFPEES